MRVSLSAQRPFLRKPSLTSLPLGCTLPASHQVHSPQAKTMFKNLAFAAATLLLTSACLADQAVEKALVAQTLDSFKQEAATVRQGMQPGGVYGYMKPAEKTRVETRLDEMQALLQNHAAQEQLS